MSEPGSNNSDIAVIGMAGRFPKAQNLGEFWANLCAGVECISFFTEAELEAAGATFPKGNPHYVKARGLLEGASLFDAAFFGIKPKEAEVMDPQHRVFLECAWEALEDAGHDPEKYAGSIGVYAGMSMNTYLPANIASHPTLMEMIGSYQLMIGNDKDFLPTRTSYKLNLKGPSLNIQTACSTSLVAITVACQQLLNYQCDIALAGAVSITFPQKRGFLFQEGGIGSPDGHCRPFDAQAAGTVGGDGVGIVVLKRLAEAQADGDHIYAVVKGFALNNDGSLKTGYTAPSVEGQADVIALAQGMADVDPRTISYVEAHGTGTPLGDPIEIAGLTQAFRTRTEAKNYCAIGSVKSAIGHLDVAAGVAGFIKTVLALHHRQLPPSLHFTEPNPKIDFANSPFFVNQRLADWASPTGPRRAGVSSFGIGGTNAHVVLEEAPPLEPVAKSRPAQLLVLSAKTASALKQATVNLAEHLRQHPEINLANAAFTLQLGRRDLPHRRTLVCRDVAEAVQLLATADERAGSTRLTESFNPPVVFMFPGQGAQQVNMGRELYESEPVFRAEVDRCAEWLKPRLKLDLRTILFPPVGQEAQAQQDLNRTGLTQPVLFTIEYALATLWKSWGIEPESMIGHSLGEYVAACLANVFPLETGLELISTRARLMQEMPAGGMLAVRLPEGDIKSLLNRDLCVATVNSLASCVISGPMPAIQGLQSQLEARQVPCVPLPVSHAFHSSMMDPMLQSFGETVAQVKLEKPSLPFISNVTGTWITDADATDPQYWVKHLRHTVRFADGLGELFQRPERVLLEVGPGHTLTSLARQHTARPATTMVMATLPPPKEASSDVSAVLTALGQLWLAGRQPQWTSFYANERRQRVTLPTYPFERKSFWIEPARARTAQPENPPGPEIISDSQVAGDADHSTPSTDRTPAPAASRRERILAQLRELFARFSGANVTSLSTTATFTEMGFESLFLTQASLAIERQFGVRVAFRQLLEQWCTLTALAGHIDQVQPAESSPTPAMETPPGNGKSTPAKSPADGNEETTLPMTEAQRELWFASQYSDAASCAYSECRLLRLRGTLHTDLLEAALQQLAARHEALRTTFAVSGDLQRIQPEMPLSLSILDWSASDPADQASHLEQLQKEEARRPFDLAQGPLIRAQLIRLGAHDSLLVLTAHHIICDGQSMGILLRELAILYSNAVAKTAATLPPPLQLGAYARIQEAARANAGDADEKYWLTQVSRESVPLELPADHSRPPVSTFNGAHAGCTVPAAIYEELKRMSSQRGSTLFSTLLAAWLVLLRRLSGQPEIIIGVPIAGRALEGGDTLVAHAVNFVPLCSTVDLDATFAAHLAAVQTRFLDAHEHQSYPIGKLLQKLQLSRQGGRMPLVTTTFNVERFGEKLDLAGLESELQLNEYSLTDFELGFNATEIDGGLQLNCRYNADLFDAGTIGRWLGHFQTLLAAAAANPGQLLGQLPLLSPAEQHQILVAWNDTAAVYPREKCLHQLVAEQAARTPNATAIIDGERRFTYQELNARAERLAHSLRLSGAGPEVLVGLCTERNAEMIMALLAIHKAGAGYVPMDPNYPQDRIAFMLEDTQAPVLVTQGKLLAKLPAHHAKVIRLDEFDWDSTPPENREPAASKSSGLAYVIYTSGSTGRPKGVAIEHRNAVNLIHWAQQVFPQTDFAGVLFSTSICFDLSIFEMFTPLTSGGTVILAENALAVPELPARHEITLINTVPSAIAELARLKAIPPTAKTVCLAGEPLKTTLVDRLYSLDTIQHVYDLYGPSETTTYSTCALRRPSVRATIGRPLANTQIYILDPRRQPVPIGVVGEVYIGGDGLAREYLHRPELTAEKFIANPWRDSGSRLYRTGDLARWFPDGTIEFLGRSDHQVKIRGHRIELGEIEALLAKQPSVKECLVLAREDTPGDQRLVAYLAGPANQPQALAELRATLEKQLPDYMIPSAFVVLTALPLTPNGKVDRKALPPPELNAEVRSAPFSPPTTPTEEALAGIWQDVLRLERVGVTDSFFDLGGHSLLATQIISRVRDAFQIDLPMRRFFEQPTIAATSLVIEEILLEEISNLSDEEARRYAGTSH